MDSLSQTDNNLINPEDSRRFLRLLMANQSRIYAFILTLVPNWVDADDIFQEVSAILWRKFGSFEPGTDFVGWAIQISRYEIMNYRKKSRRNIIQFDQDLMELLEKDRGKETARDDARLAALQGCVRKLCERDQKIINMRYEEGNTIMRMADRVGVSVRALYRTLARIHDNLLRCVRLTLNMEP